MPVNWLSRQKFIKITIHSILNVSVLTIWTILMIVKMTNTNTIQGKLPDLTVLTSFLEELIRPHLKIIENKSPLRNFQETSIEKVMKDKIAELNPFLQDDDYKIFDIDDNLTLEGNDETTIIEFLPPDKEMKKADLRYKPQSKEPLRMNIQKYKKAREKINKALVKESVSEITKSLVTKTLDQLIAQLIGSQCVWKSAVEPGKTFRQTDNEKVQVSLELANNWNKHWDRLRKEYTQLINDNTITKTDSTSKIFTFFEEFNDFIAYLMNDMKSISKRYRIRCQLLDKQEDNSFKHKLNMTNDLQSQSKAILKSKYGDQCSNFKVCSDELKDFMLSFYNSLTDTVTSALKNYAVMYTRDVNDDTGHEKEMFITIMNNITHTIDSKLCNTFKKETIKFKLNPEKNRDANIKALRDYIKNTIKRVKNDINKRLETDLAVLRTKLRLIIQEDIRVNCDVELGNLKRDFEERICTIFEICNGKYMSRREIGHFRIPQTGSDSVYVKVQMTLDDDLKDMLAQEHAKLHYTIKSNFGNYVNFGINVTRTTSFNLFNMTEFA